MISKLLADVCDVQYGYAFDSSLFSNDNGLPLVRIRDLVRGYSETRTTEKCPDNYIVNNGDLLIGMDGEFNIAKWKGGKALLNQRVCKLIPKAEIVDPDYLYYYMPIALKAIEDKTPFVTVKHLSAKEINKISIPMLDIQAQQKVAKVLSLIEFLISNSVTYRNKLNELIKSRFIEMFGDILINNKEWDSAPLGDLCTIVRGGSPRPIENYLGGTIPWIKIGDATEGSNLYLYSTKEKIIEEGIKKSRYIKSGSLIFANCGVSLGFARIIQFNGCIHDGWLALEDIDSRLNKVFLLFTLNSMTQYFRRIAPDGTQPNLNTAIMKKHIQVIPPIDLQNQFADFVTQVEKQKATVQKSIDKLETLKKSLMQEYFG